ncbi:MAG: tRNA (adenosine(37)-N6)-threonylcarbamoyltransferase complex dimerization subunit type 1 TsaB [Candidatus Omnitrophica bacterium]|nr:tRNA (adenosine(37)-N6)-threonylcarbamoyltransferase complex dimerization subunit type 1 TsaB [Candidatus Omnitrophota bacterium]MCM8825548.1 tRNA (adenosine(37)-N6)-threonylcarbamoyltransferase complex dimerization subunit type 1 TsaB [Candidatus Omnitrophota bacterium]
MKDKKTITKKVWKSKDASLEILPAIDEILNKTKMSPEMFDFFVVSSGPGSWTGIRLGFSVALGLSAADERKIFGLSSIESIAYKFRKAGPAGVFLPSRGNHIHYGFFSNPGLLEKKHGKLFVCEIEQLHLKLGKASIIAGPDEKILSSFASTRIVRKVRPCPVLNALLALERIKNGVKPVNQPYYEK